MSMCIFLPSLLSPSCPHVSWLYTSTLLCTWAICSLGFPQFWPVWEALQFYICSNFQSRCFFSYLFWPGGVSPEFPFCPAQLSALATPVPHPALLFPAIKTLSVLCILNSPSHEMAKGSDVVLNAVAPPSSIWKYLDTFCSGVQA